MILTSTVKIKSKKYLLMPVKTSGDIPLEKVPEAMALINKTELCAPVKTGTVIIASFVENGISLIATKTIEE